MIVQSFKNLFLEEKGQAMTEYVLVTVIAVLCLASCFTMFQKALKAYYTRIANLISLPIP
ncbi:hypothetical protein KAW08_02440 [bacterium]|nr:hypothetical protein [bacterium]